MTSTNDGKDVKSNQTSGQKGKTYYIELYKSLDASLNAEGSLSERVAHLSAAWRRVHTLCVHSAPSTHPHLLTWISRHTARTIFQSEWQSATCKDEHDKLLEAINDFIQECENAATGRDGVVLPWESQLVSRAEWFKGVLGNPWEHPVLKALLEQKEASVSTEQILEWLKEERGVVFAARIRQLALSKKCVDIALAILTPVMDRMRACRHIVPDHELAEERETAEPKNKEPTFQSILSEEAGFNDVWDQLTDLEFVLLHKCDRNARLIALAKAMPLGNGYQVVERLLNKLEVAPKEKRIWKNAKDVATVIVQVMITRCMVVPRCGGQVLVVLYWMGRALVRCVPPAKIARAASTLCAPASSARHLHTLANAVNAQESEISEELKPYVVELYVRAITSGMNELEKLKLKPEYEEKEARATEYTLASWFIQLGHLLAHSARMKCECILTAFSLHPSPAMYDRIKQAPALPTMPKDIQPKQEAEVKSEFGSWANDSRTQTNFVKTSETLNMQHTKHQANTLSTAILNEGEALGLDAELCQDIIVLLSGPRVKTLSWDMDRQALLDDCRTHMERTQFGTRVLTTELKYLNLDPANYQHLPEEDEDEDDVYYGIEKGYEHLVEIEPQPEEIWEDAYDPERTHSAHSSYDEEEYIVKKKNSKSNSSDSEDPLSTVAEKKEKKKERPHSKERSKERKKKPKEDKSKDQEGAEKNQNEGKDKKKEKKERKKRENKEKRLKSALIGLKVAKTEDDPLNVMDVDYDGQGKASEGTDPLKLTEKPKKATKPKEKTTQNKQLAAARLKAATAIQNAQMSLKKLSETGSSNHIPNMSRSNSSLREEVKKEITKLIQFRRQKMDSSSSTSSSQLPSTSRAPTPHSPLIGAKVANTSLVFNQQQSNMLNDMRSKAKSYKASFYPPEDPAAPTPCSRMLAYYRKIPRSPREMMSRSHETLNLSKTSPQSLYSDLRSPPQVVEKSPQTDKTHLSSYERFLQELQKNSDAGLFRGEPPKTIEAKKKEMKPKSRVTPVVPHIKTESNVTLPMADAVKTENVMATSIPNVPCESRAGKIVPKQETIIKTEARVIQATYSGPKHDTMVKMEPRLNQATYSSPKQDPMIKTEPRLNQATYSGPKQDPVIKTEPRINQAMFSGLKQGPIVKTEPGMSQATFSGPKQEPIAKTEHRVSYIGQTVAKQEPMISPQSAKPIVQPKKVDVAPNTFARLSYMHKNKLNEKNKQLTDASSSLHNDISDEIDRRIADLRTAKVKAEQSKMEFALSRVNAAMQAKSNEPPRVEVQSIEPAPSEPNKQHPLITNILRQNTVTLVAPTAPAHKCSSGSQKAPQKSQIRTPNKNTALTEKDQHDLLRLLGQQNLLNRPQSSINAQSKNVNNQQLHTSGNASNKISTDSAPLFMNNTITFKSIPVQNQVPCPAQSQANTPNSNHTLTIINKGIQQGQSNEKGFNFPMISNTTIMKTTAMVQNKLQVPPNQQKKTKQKAAKQLNDTQNTGLEVNKNQGDSKKYVPKPPVPVPKCNNDLGEQDWTKVLDAIRAHKTPSRGPNALDMLLNKDSFEKMNERNQQTHSPLPATTAGNQTAPAISTQVNTTILQTASSKTLTSKAPARIQKQSKKKVSLLKQDVTVTKQLALQNPVKVYPEMIKHSQPQETQLGADPFISGIPNSDYEILEELMDDDLRQEIGELFSDEESYYAPDQLATKPCKTNESINQNIGRKIKNLDSLILLNQPKTKELQTTSSGIQTNNKAKPQIISNEKVNISFKNLVGSKIIRQEPKTMTPKAQPGSIYNVNNTLPSTDATSTTTSSMIYNAAPTPAVQNLVIINPYAPTSNVNQSYVTVNNTPNVIKFTAGTPDQIIISQNYVPNVIPPATVNVGFNNSLQPVVSNIPLLHIPATPRPTTPIQTIISRPNQPSVQSNVKQAEDKTAFRSSHTVEPNQTQKSAPSITKQTPPDILQQKVDSKVLPNKIDTSKTNERKVLSEVQEKTTKAEVEMKAQEKIGPVNIKNQKTSLQSEGNSQASKDDERLMKKRLSIMNRNINSSSLHQTIPLSYTPLTAFRAALKEEKQKNEKNLVMDTPKLDNTKIAPVITVAAKQKVLIDTNKNKKDNANTSSCRRILLRSSNKVETVTTNPKSSNKGRLTDSITTGSQKSEENKIDEKAENKLGRVTPHLNESAKEVANYTVRKENNLEKKVEVSAARVSKRLKDQTQIKTNVKPNKEVAQDSGNKIGSTDDSKKSAQEIFDIEEALEGTLIPKANEIDDMIKAKETKRKLIRSKKPNKKKDSVSEISNDIIISSSPKICQNNPTNKLKPAADAKKPIDTEKKEPVIKDPADNISLKPKHEEIKLGQNKPEKKIREKEPAISGDDLKTTTFENKIRPTGNKFTVSHKLNKLVDDIESVICAITQSAVSSPTSENLEDKGVAEKVNQNLDIKTTDILLPEKTSTIKSLTDVQSVTKTQQCNLETFETKPPCIKDQDDKSLNSAHITKDSVPCNEENVTHKTNTKTVKSPLVVANLQTSKPKENQINNNKTPTVKLAKSKEVNKTIDKEIVLHAATADPAPSSLKSRSKEQKISHQNEKSSCNKDIEMTEVINLDDDDPEEVLPEINTAHKPSSNTNTAVPVDTRPFLKSIIENNDNDIIALSSESDKSANKDVISLHSESDLDLNKSKTQAVDKLVNKETVSLNKESDLDLNKSETQVLNKSANTSADNATLVSEAVPQSYKDSIKFEEIPIPGNKNPWKRCVRIVLPNKKSYKATVQGKINVSFDTLFEEPALKNILLSSMGDRKRYLLNIQQLSTPDRRIVETQVQGIDIQEPREYCAPTNTSEVVNLISDDEEEVTYQTITTATGTFKVNIDEEMFKIHKEKLKQTCAINLKRCDRKRKTEVLVQALLEDLAVIETIPTEVIEIDDSSSDNETFQGETGIDLLKDMLLKDLGVAETNLTEEQPVTVQSIISNERPSRTRKSKYDQERDSRSVSAEPTQQQTSSRPKRSVKLKINKCYCCSQEDSNQCYSKIIKRDCSVKLINCDNLVKEMREKAETREEATLTDDEVITCSSDYDILPLSRSGSFSILNELDSMDQTILPRDEVSSPVMRVFETIHALSKRHKSGKSSPVMEAFDMIVDLQQRFKEPPTMRLSEDHLCTSDWFDTKRSIHLQKLSHETRTIDEIFEEIIKSKLDISTDCETDAATDLSIASENVHGVAFKVPRLTTIMAKYIADNPIVYHFKSIACTDDIPKTPLKRKLQAPAEIISNKITKTSDQPVNIQADEFVKTDAEKEHIISAHQNDKLDCNPIYLAVKDVDLVIETEDVTIIPTDQSSQPNSPSLVDENDELIKWNDERDKSLKDECVDNSIADELNKEINKASSAFLSDLEDILHIEKIEDTYDNTEAEIDSTISSLLSETNNIDESIPSKSVDSAEAKDKLFIPTDESSQPSSPSLVDANNALIKWNNELNKSSKDERVDNSVADVLNQEINKASSASLSDHEDITPIEKIVDTSDNTEAQTDSTISSLYSETNNIYKSRPSKFVDSAEVEDKLFIPTDQSPQPNSPSLVNANNALIKWNDECYESLKDERVDDSIADELNQEINKVSSALLSDHEDIPRIEKSKDTHDNTEAQIDSTISSLRSETNSIHVSRPSKSVDSVEAEDKLFIPIDLSFQPNSPCLENENNALIKWNDERDKSFNDEHANNSIVAELNQEINKESSASLSDHEDIPHIEKIEDTYDNTKVQIDERETNNIDESRPAESSDGINPSQSNSPFLVEASNGDACSDGWLKTAETHSVLVENSLNIPNNGAISYEQVETTLLNVETSNLLSDDVTVESELNIAEPALIQNETAHLEIKNGDNIRENDKSKTTANEPKNPANLCHTKYHSINNPLSSEVKSTTEPSQSAMCMHNNFVKNVSAINAEDVSETYESPTNVAEAASDLTNAIIDVDDCLNSTEETLTLPSAAIKSTSALDKHEITTDTDVTTLISAEETPTLSSTAIKFTSVLDNPEITTDTDVTSLISDEETPTFSSTAIKITSSLDNPEIKTDTDVTSLVSAEETPTSAITANKNTSALEKTNKCYSKIITRDCSVKLINCDNLVKEMREKTKSPDITDNGDKILTTSQQAEIEENSTQVTEIDENLQDVDNGTPLKKAPLLCDAQLGTIDSSALNWLEGNISSVTDVIQTKGQGTNIVGKTAMDSENSTIIPTTCNDLPTDSNNVLKPNSPDLPIVNECPVGYQELVPNEKLDKSNSDLQIKQHDEGENLHISSVAVVIQTEDQTNATLEKTALNSENTSLLLPKQTSPQLPSILDDECALENQELVSNENLSLESLNSEADLETEEHNEGEHLDENCELDTNEIITKLPQETHEINVVTEVAENCNNELKSNDMITTDGSKNQISNLSSTDASDKSDINEKTTICTDDDSKITEFHDCITVKPVKQDFLLQNSADKQNSMYHTTITDREETDKTEQKCNLQVTVPLEENNSNPTEFKTTDRIRFCKDEVIDNINITSCDSRLSPNINNRDIADNCPSLSPLPNAKSVNVDDSYAYETEVVVEVQDESNKSDKITNKTAQDDSQLITEDSIKNKGENCVDDEEIVVEKTIEEVECDEMVFEKNATLVYKDDSGVILKGIEYEDPEMGTYYVFPLTKSSDDTGNSGSDVLNSSVGSTIEVIQVLETSTEDQDIELNEEIFDEPDLQVTKPRLTYSKRNLKRKSNMKDVTCSAKRSKRNSRSRDSSEVKITEKRYRKGKNIDAPRLSAMAIGESGNVKDFKRRLDYYSTVGFSYSITFSTEFIDAAEVLQNWPITGPIKSEIQEEHEIGHTIFNDLEQDDEKIRDPLQQTLVEELTAHYNETDYPNTQTEETNFNMGFGEGSGRVIQNLSGDTISNFSAATLSDVKHTQPCLLSENISFLKSSKQEVQNINRYLTYVKLKDKVRSFFKNTTFELNRELEENTKDSTDYLDASSFPFGLYNSKCIEPFPTETVVQVVQVGQLPVSAAAQNPVTCDPRVTQVSDASPSQCSVENSPHDDSQPEIKTEYTELTTADLNLPMVDDYVHHNQTLPGESQKSSNMSMNTENIPIETELVKSEVKIELEEESPDEKEANELSEANNHINNVDYLYNSNNSNPSANSEFQTLFESDKQDTSETGAQHKVQNGSSEKTDQIAHAMNAAGITTSESANTRAQALVNMLTQKLRQGAIATAPNSTNNFSKTTSINAMSLQQALASILPPPLNQTNSTESNQQSQNNTPQVLHIVQGKNSAGNQITLVDNTQQSVITTPNATPVLHIVQNKTVQPGQNSNNSPAPQSNTFSGLSLVDAGLQQGGNQLLHIVNTGNQKNNNAGQLLKRVNLLTNLANVQGANEQKMVQFVCKSADGKAIQLNAPHQRSMVLRLQPIESTNVQPATPKPADTNPDLSQTQSATDTDPNKDSSPSQQEIKSRSVYEENYAKFIQNSSTKPTLLEKSNSLPKFNQAFGKAVFQDGNQKQNEMNSNSLPAVNTSTDNSESATAENPINIDHIGQISSPPLLLRKSPATQTSQAPQNLVQQIKQTIAPMNIQTMHGGVIYTRQIPVNIGGGQTINLITVPSTELIDESVQKQQGSQGETIEPSIIKIVPQSQPPSNAEVSDEMNNDNAQQSTPQPQPVLTQMRIKLPMLSKTPQMVSGTRVVRPSFFQIQRNVIGGANQVYQQLVLTAAPPIGQQTIRLPQAQTRQIKVPENQSSSESQMSSSTLEQLREFDMVLEQVKERSTVQPNSNSGSSFKLHTPSTDTTDSPVTATSTSVETTQVLYSIGSSQPLNVTYVNRKPSVTTPTTSTFVRSPDSSGIADSPTSSSHSHSHNIPHASTSEASSSETTTHSHTHQHHKPVKVSSKSKSRPKSSSHSHSSLKLNSVPPKTSTQKPLEDEQTTQRILYILAEYKEQVENSPDKDKPAPRRRSNPPSNPGSSKRKKSSSGSRRSGRDTSPMDDTCRTMGSEDSSCGTSQGDCTESCMDSHSPQDSPRKVARKLAFEQDPPTPQPKLQPQRNVIVADGQTITVARGTTGKPTTTVLMPTNYILPVSMVKGGQQIAIVTNRGPKLLTVGGGEGNTTNALLLQRLIGPAGLKPVLTRPGVRHVRLPTAALHNLQAFNLASATNIQPPDSTASPAADPPQDIMDTNRSDHSPWTDRDSEIKPDRASSPDESEPWNLPSSADPNDYSYEETVRADNMDRTVLDPIQDRYSPELEAQRIFDKMFDVDTKKSYIVDSPRCGYDIDASDCDDKSYQVVHKKDSHRQTRLSHVSAAALRHKYAILEHELRLQKSLSEECEDLGVDSPSASELFPEAELLFAASPAQDHAPDTPQHSHTPQPILQNQSVIQPDIDDQIATDQLIPRHQASEDRQELDVNLGLEDVGIVTVSDDGMQATIALDQEEFARAHPNTTFHSEPTDDGVVHPFTMSNLKSRHITSTIFHSNRAPATVLMTAPQTTVISQAAPETSQNPVKYSDIDNIIHSIPSTHNNNINLSSVLVKDDGLTRFDNILTDSRELHLSNTASAIVHSGGNATQVIRRVCYDDKRGRESFLMDEPDALIAGDDAKMVAEDSSRDATMESMGDDVDDDNSSPERHAELFWESNSASERSESRRPLEFSSDSEKCCKSPSYDETNSTDSSGVGTHMRLDSVIKDARGIERSGSADGSSADDTHPPLRTYPPKRPYQHTEGEMERSLSGKTRAGERSPDMEVRRRASGRGVVKRGCHCCNGSPAPQRPKKPRQRKPTIDFTN